MCVPEEWERERKETVLLVKELDGTVPELTLTCSAHLIGMHSLLCVIYINVLIKGLLCLLGARWIWLTVHGHAHGDALFEAAQLTLVPCDLVNDAAAFILAGVGWMKVLLNGSTEETLNKDNTKTQVHKDRREKEQVVMGLTRGRNCLCLSYYLCDIC